MRHKKAFNHLGRKKGHRSAMMSNMASSLIEHKRINTTLAKAKALRGYVEPLITKSKTDSTHSRRIIFSYLQSKEAVTELFRTVAPKIAERPGGYTRIIKTGFRQGDAAEMAMIELVDFNEIYNNTEKAPAKKTRRRRKSSGSSDAPAQEADATKAADSVEQTEEAPKAEAAKEETKKEAPAKGDDSKEEDSKDA